MVTPLRRPFWTILLSLTTIAFLYLTLLGAPMDQDLHRPKSYRTNIKNVVAYSLLKRIEIESGHYTCDKVQTASGLNYSAINGSDEVDNESSTWTNIDGTHLHVLSVHMDGRLDPYRYVRIIGMIRGHIQESIYCQISTPTETVYVTKVTITPIWLDIWDQNDTNIYYNPVLLSCRVPFDLTPNNVSLTTKPCHNEQGNTFRISSDEPSKRYTFTVCVKPLDFLDDISERLIQWIELVRILGAEKIEIYIKKVRKNVWKILKWYNSNYPGELVIRKFQVITEAPAKKKYSFSRKVWQKRRYEVVTYNSCFYRNMGTSEYIIPLDIDEIILPKQGFTWKNTLRDIFTLFPETKENFASFMVPNTYFFENSPRSDVENIFFLKNVLRSQFSPSGESGKSFISASNTLTVFNHYALDVLKPGVSRTFFLPSSVVQLNHYKNSCNAVILPECIKYVSSPRIKDLGVFKYETVFKCEYFKKISLFKGLGLL